MKRITKIILVNITAVLAICLSAEFYCFKKADDKYPFLVSASKIHSMAIDEAYDLLTAQDYALENSIDDFKFRRPVGINYKKKPIIVFGCSFAWGVRLNEHQTFYYKLSELTKRPVYNRAVSGWSVQHMLYQLKRKDFYEAVPAPEYIVYVYISNHISRMFKYYYINLCAIDDYNYMKYNNFFGRLILEHRLQHIPYSRLLDHIILKYIALRNENNPKKAFTMLEKHLIECRKAVEKHWGEQTKFIMLYYDSKDAFNNHPEVLNGENIKKLLNDGIIVIKASELTGRELGRTYHLEEYDEHPNEAAWNLITPAFADALEKL